MGIEEQLLLQVDIYKKEGEQVLQTLYQKRIDVEGEFEKIKKEIEQVKGMIAALNKVQQHGIELLTQPDEIRKLGGMK